MIAWRGRVLRFLILWISSFVYFANAGEGISYQERPLLSSTRTIEEAFEQVANVQLELKPECAISLITDLAVDSEGRYVIADGWQSKGVYIFSRDGKFIRELGRRGQGPGEYQTPVSVTIGSNGDVWVADYAGNRISVYDKAWRFKHAILGQPRILYFLHLNSKDEIYMYRSQANPMQPDTSDTIFQYDREGRKISSFAPFPEEALKVKFWAGYDGMEIGPDDSVYEMNPLFYRIRKFTADRRLVASFGRKTKLFKLETKSGERPVIVNGPFYLQGGFLIAQVNDHLEVYDTAGRFIAGELPFAPRIIGSHGNQFYAEASNDDDRDNNPRIVSYRLRGDVLK